MQRAETRRGGEEGETRGSWHLFRDVWMIRRDVRPSKVLGLFVSGFTIGETRVGLKTETCWKEERGMTKSWVVSWERFFFGGADLINLLFYLALLLNRSATRGGRPPKTAFRWMKVSWLNLGQFPSTEVWYFSIIPHSNACPSTVFRMPRGIRSAESGSWRQEAWVKAPAWLLARVTRLNETVNLAGPAFPPL